MAFEETKEQHQMYNYFRSCIYIFLIIEIVMNLPVTADNRVTQFILDLLGRFKGALLLIIFTFPLMAHYGIAGALLASGIIFLYDGTRGFIRSKPAKYCFYTIYPAHLMLLAAFL